MGLLWRPIRRFSCYWIKQREITLNRLAQHAKNSTLAASAATALFLLFFALPSHGQGLAQDGIPAQDAVPAASTGTPIPLPTIPPPTAIALPPADADSVSELSKLLADLSNVVPKDRDRAIAALAEQDESMLSAIAARLIDLRKNADRDGMTTLLEAARKEARKELKRGETEDSESAAADDTTKPIVETQHALMDPNTTDWLRYVLQTPKDTQAYRDIVAVLALSRSCVAIGTTAAAREVINVYMYFGDLFRIDVQRQLARMRDMAVPALVEAQYHDSRMVRTWAKRRLDVMGRAIPSEAVRLNDNQALADVLRAYGRAREVEAVRVIVSFANGDRLQVREAAREAIGQIGEPAHWQLRDAYEQLMGDKPSRSWDWQRTARELFAVYDRARLHEIYAAMDRGLAAAEDGNTEEAVALFDRVLAGAPMFERREEMAPTYLKQAQSIRAKDRVAAAAMLHRALSIAPNGEHADAVRSELALIEAEELAENGFWDTALIERAMQLDPSNSRAKAMREQADAEMRLAQGTWHRYAAAVAIGVLALAAMVFVALLPKRRQQGEGRKRAAHPPHPTPDAAPPPMK